MDAFFSPFFGFLCLSTGSQESLLTTLEGWGFEVARPRLGPTASAEDLVEFHRRLARERPSLGYAVDGVVYKLDDLALQVRQPVGVGSLV